MGECDESREFEDQRYREFANQMCECHYHEAYEIFRQAPTLTTRIPVGDLLVYHHLLFENVGIQEADEFSTIISNHFRNIKESMLPKLTQYHRKGCQLPQPVQSTQPESSRKETQRILPLSNGGKTHR